jgi:hypothetical protein
MPVKEEIEILMPQLPPVIVNPFGNKELVIPDHRHYSDIFSIAFGHPSVNF